VPEYWRPADRVLQDVAEDMGVGHTYRRTPVGVYFGQSCGCQSCRSADAKGPPGPRFREGLSAHGYGRPASPADTVLANP
jgi:hypothetical protein